MLVCPTRVSPHLDGTTATTTLAGEPDTGEPHIDRRTQRRGRQTEGRRVGWLASATHCESYHWRYPQLAASFTSNAMFLRCYFLSSAVPRLSKGSSSQAAEYLLRASSLAMRLALLRHPHPLYGCATRVIIYIIPSPSMVANVSRRRGKGERTGAGRANEQAAPCWSASQYCCSCLPSRSSGSGSPSSLAFTRSGDGWEGRGCTRKT